MKDEIESLQKLINAFTYLPGVGRKTAERYAYSILNLSEDETNFFAESIVEAKQKIKFCSVCGNFTDNDVCEICLNRKSDIVCVVKEPNRRSRSPRLWYICSNPPPKIQNSWDSISL